MAEDPEKLKGEDLTSYLKAPTHREETPTHAQQAELRKIVEANVDKLQNASNAEVNRVLLEVAHDKTIRDRVGYALSHHVAKLIADELEKIRKARRRK